MENVLYLILSGFAGSFPTAVGCYIISRLQLRKMYAREKCKQIEHMIDEFGEKSCRYWKFSVNKKQAEFLAFDVKNIIRKITLEISHLTYSNRDARRDCEATAIKLRQKALGGNFESRERKIPDNARIEEIQGAAGDLKIKLRKALKVD